MIGPFQFPFNGQFFWKHCLMASTFHPWKNEKTHLQQPKTLKHPPLCKECKLNLSKYTCPGCSVPSCSLPCVEAHKQHTGCTGKRQRTQFFPLSQFDDNLLLSDNFFSRFCSLLSNFNTHLAILKICHEWSVVTIEEVYCFILFYFFISLKFWYVSPFWRCSVMVYCN